MSADLRFRFRSLFKKNAVEDDLNDELRFHFDHHIEKLIASGVPPAEARRRARLALGTHDKIREDYRDASGIRFFETLMQDIRFALRMLRKSPGFTTIAILTLALGIGANTAIFSLFDGLVLRNLAVPHPEQLIHFGAHAPSDDYPLVSFPMFQEISRDQKVFSGTFAWWGDGVFNVEANGQLLHGDIWAVTGNFYSELGATPEFGRLIEPGDVNLNAVAATQVAVLGYAFWQRNYGGDKKVIGKVIKVEGVPFTIIGVMHKGFTGMDADSEPEVTVPLTAEPLIAGDTTEVQKHLQRRDVLWLDAAGRLKPGVTLVQARAELDSLWPAIRQASMPLQPTAAERDAFLSLQMKAESDAVGDSFLRRQFAKPIYVLLAISAVVLLLACINLASLMLSRAAARKHEFGVRVALGAGRARLARQVLTESVMISVAGTLAGLALATWGSRAFAAFVLRETYITPSALNLSPDLRILGFVAAIAIFTGVLFGLAPAWRATREGPNWALQQSSRMVGPGTGKLGKGLIVMQVALSLMLLSAAGLFIRTLEKLRTVHPGFQTHDVIEFDLLARRNAFKNADMRNYFRELTERISSLPGVASVGVEHMGIGSIIEWKEKFRAHGASDADFSGDCEMAMPGFFRTENISLLRGRTFTWQDDGHAPFIAIVSENFAKKVFLHSNAIGRHIDVATEPKWQNLEIVGVVSNASLYDIRKPAQPTVYLATLQYGDYADDDELLVRTIIPSAAIVPSIRQTINELGRHTVIAAKLLTEVISRSILQERITAMLSAFFGALALLIAGIGLFGLMAYDVTQRTRELGIRFALGAQRATVLRMILRETLVLTLIGVAVGLPCALAATRLIAHMLFGVTPYDPVTLVAVAIALLGVGALAGYIPARRAMRVDPIVALRYE